MNAFEGAVAKSGEKEGRVLYGLDDQLIPIRKDFSVSVEARSESDAAKEKEMLEGLAHMASGAERIEESEYAAEARKVVSQIDYGTMREIYDGLRSRSGAQGESGFCGRDRIRVDDGMAGGEYGLKDGITIGSYPLQSSDNVEVSRAAFRNAMLCAIIHEEAHASSKNIDKRAPSKRFLEPIRSFFGRRDPDLATGYHRRQFENGKKKIVFRDLNEGVTEKIAEEVHGEYLRRTGSGADFSDRDHPVGYHDAAYLGSKAITEAFVGIIARSVGVSEEVVWQALKQGYMAGIDLRETELEQAFEEIFSEGFMERLSEWGSGEQGKVHDEILRKVESLDLVGETAERIRIAFDRYREDREDRLDRYEA